MLGDAVSYGEIKTNLFPSTTRFTELDLYRLVQFSKDAIDGNKGQVVTWQVYSSKMNLYLALLFDEAIY